MPAKCGLSHFWSNHVQEKGSRQGRRQKLLMNPEIIERLLQRLAEGESLKKAAKAEAAAAAKAAEEAAKAEAEAAPAEEAAAEE